MKKSTKISFRPTRNQRRIAAAFMLISFLPTAVMALPTAPLVVNGIAAISTSGNVMTITNSANAIINWQGFSIGNNETTRFIQPSAASAVLNRITGGDPSAILGALQSNGKVLLINPNGILFGPNSRLDVGGLIASSLGISNQDFLAGKMNFSAGPIAGKVDNQGAITTPGGGQVYLIAPDVANSGIITAPNGDILLAAGKEVLLVDKSNPDIAMVVSAPEHQTINLGTLVADAGRVGMYGGIVRQKGRISADSAVMEGGRIFLKATKSIELADSSVISADGVKGGQVVVKTEEDGKLSGTLTARGTISAQGDGTKGSGGFIETSAKTVDINSVRVNTRGGSWLLDPDDVEITSTTPTISGATIVTPGIIQNALVNNDFTIQTNAATTGGNGDIFVNGAVSWNSQYSLTLNAIRNVNVNQAITSSGSGSVNLRADSTGACVAGAETCGTVSFTGSGHVTAATTNIYYNPSGSNNAADANGVGPSYATPTSFAGKVTGTLNSYMLVNDVNQLQGMNTNLAGNYALGNNINATATNLWNGLAGFMPTGDTVTPFTGTLDGLGHTINGLTINRPSTDNVGLFGVMAQNATLRNVGLVGGSITGYENVGPLAGYACTLGGAAPCFITLLETIDHTYSTASVNGYANVGGLVGFNGGNITNSYSAGDVTGIWASIGGLVGITHSPWPSGGTGISSSYATGNVTATGTGPGTGAVGGLVGADSGTSWISNSYATGRVTAVAATAYVGGLLGWNDAGQISNSYATGAVSGGSYNGGLLGYHASFWGGVTSSYWDKDTTGQATSAGGGTGINSSTGTVNAYNQATYSGFDFTSGSPIWWMSPGNTRPFLRSEYSTTITNAHQLQLIGMNSTTLAANYTLANNINMTELTLASGMWDVTKRFVPVSDLATPFSGTFDGLGHSITNFTINRPSTDYVGLFGYLGSGSTIQNVGLVSGSVSGKANVGDLIGYSSGTVISSYATGNVSGTTDNAGGLVGYNAGGIFNSYATGNVSTTNNAGGLVGYNYSTGNATISNSYATGNTSGTSAVGGLVGQNYINGSIRNSYATGSVTGTGTGYIGGLVGENVGSIINSYATGSVPGISLVGGLAGYNSNSGTVTNSYWDKDSSGRTTSAGSADSYGLTTAQMMTTNFAAWDTSTWGILPGISYPYLKWQFNGTPQIISGTVDVTGGGRNIQTAVDGTLLAHTSTGANGFYYLALPGNSVPTGSKLLTYVDGNAVKGSSVTLSSGSHITGLSLLSDTLSVSNIGDISYNTFSIAKGGLTSADILYSVSGDGLVVAAKNLKITNSGSIFINSPITIAGGAVLLTATGTASDISVNALIKTGDYISGSSAGSAGDVSLTAGRNILLGVTGTAIDASIGADGNGTTTGHGGDVSLTAAGSIIGTTSDISTNVYKYQNGSTGSRAGNISLIANGGDVIIRNLSASASQNDNGGIIGNGGNVSVTASGSVSVGAVNTSSTGATYDYYWDNGDTSIGNGGNVNLTATNGNLTISGDVDARAVYLGGNRTPTSVGTGGNIVLMSDGNVSINSNLFTTGISQSGGGNVSISNNGGITINGGISSNGGAVGLTATGTSSNISINGSITTGFNGNGYSVGDAGDVSLTAGHDILLLNGSTIDASVRTNSNGTTTGRGGNVSLTAGGSITGASNISTFVIKDGSGSIGSSAGNVSLIARDGSIVIGDISSNASQNGAYWDYYGIAGTIGSGGTVTATASGSIAIGRIDTSASASCYHSPCLLNIGNGGNINLAATTGNITINGLVEARANGSVAYDSIGTSGNITLTAGSTIANTNYTTVRGNLLTTSSSGGTTLTSYNNVNGNSVTSFNATNTGNGDIIFNNTSQDALTITGISQTASGGAVSVSNAAGITATGNITLSGGTATLNTGLNGYSASTLTIASGKSVTTNGGNIFIKATDVDLQGTLNAGVGDVSITASNNNSIGLGLAEKTMTISDTELRNITATNLLINSGSYSQGIFADGIQATDTTHIGNVKLNSHYGNISFENNPSTFNGNLTLTTLGSVTQSLGASIQAVGLELLGSGTFTLDDPGNRVSAIAANVTNSIKFTNGNTLLRVDSVNTTTGITTTTGAIDISTQDATLRVTSPITNNDTNGAVTLSTNATLGSGAGITGTGLISARNIAVQPNSYGPIGTSEHPLNTGTIGTEPTTFAIGSGWPSAVYISHTGKASVGATLGSNAPFSFTASDDITITTGIVQAGSDLTLRSTYGSLFLNGPLLGSNVHLYSTGVVSQASASGITADRLELLGAGAYYLLTGNNNVGTLTGSTTNDRISGVAFNNGTHPLTIDSATKLTATDFVAINSAAGSLNDITATNMISINGGVTYCQTGAYCWTGSIDSNWSTPGNWINGGGSTPASATTAPDSGNAVRIISANSIAPTITINNSATADSIATNAVLVQDAPISANNLRLLGTNIDYVLNNTGNSIGTIAGVTKSLNFATTGNFIVGGLTATNDIFLATSSGVVTQTAPISAYGLGLFGAGSSFTLNNSDNHIHTLAGNVASVELVNKQMLLIDTVNNYDGLKATGDITLTATGLNGQGGLAVNKPIISTGGDITLNGSGGYGFDGHYYGVQLDGTSVITNGGNITINGTGGYGPSDNNHGIYSLNSSIDSHGGTVTLNGIGGNGINWNIGVYLDEGTRISTSGGDLSITGSGGSASPVSGNTYERNHGIYTYSTTLDTGTVDGSTVGGKITLSGTGGVGFYTDNDDPHRINGVFLDYGTKITTGGGELGINGTGGEGNVSELNVTRYNGIYTSDATLDTSRMGQTTGGDIRLIGIAGNSFSSESGNHNYGVSLTSTSIKTGGGNLNITDNSDLSGSGKGGISIGNSSTLDTNRLDGSRGGDILLYGTAGGGSTYSNTGVNLYNSTITTGGGNLDITGFSNGTGDQNRGVYLSGSILDTSRSDGSTGGNISMNGTGGINGTNDNDGVIIERTNITTSGGTLDIIGIGGGTGVRNNGISIYGSLNIDTGKSDSSAGGAINLTGTSGYGTDDNVGVRLNDSYATDYLNRSKRALAFSV